MTRIYEIRDRLDKATLWMNQTQDGNVTYACVTLLANAQDDIRWLLHYNDILEVSVADYREYAHKAYARGLNEHYEKENRAHGTAGPAKASLLT